MPPGAPRPPAMVKGEALAEWKRVVPALDDLGILSRADRAVLVAYCQTWARWVQLDGLLTREGLTVAARDGARRKHPAWQMAREASSLLTALAAQLGLSPAARLRMPAPPRDVDPDEILD